MKKTLTAIVKILLFLPAFFATLWFCLPWREVGKFAMNIAASQLSTRGNRIAYSDVTGTDDGFIVHNLTANGMADISFGSLALRPRIAASILSLAPVFRIEFRGMNVRLGQVLNLGDGEMMLTAGREILLENLRTNGDFAVNGSLAVNPSAWRITQADAGLDIPENFAGSMEMLKNFLPLEQVGGRWYLRRK